MSQILAWLLAFGSGMLAVPVAIFCLEIAAASLLRRRKVVPPGNGARARVAVLVPAHNEESGLLRTLADIKAQLHDGDRLLVTADNCTDDTAAIARRAGAEVAERHDLTRIGKGYALDFGLAHLRTDPPDVVVMIDADCRLTDGSIDALARTCRATGAPAQALNLMIAPEASPVDYRVAIFAFRIKNWVRPLGLQALNLPCQLTGTGMAFPWSIIAAADLANGVATEDLKLGLDLARAGHPAVFCPAAKVESQFPASRKGSATQRTRWEQGHIGMIRRFPRLLGDGLRDRNIDLLALAIDTLVPPLTLLGAGAGFMAAASIVGRLCGLASAGLPISMAALAAFMGALVLCWLQVGRDVLPAGSIASFASYAVNKISLYRRMLSRRHDLQWIRTDRGRG
jgi:cellulose synthase/poly-beta-1,6-N-acetylglucosamine synthase-like glycosyltransferase